MTIYHNKPIMKNVIICDTEECWLGFIRMLKSKQTSMNDETMMEFLS